MILNNLSDSWQDGRRRVSMDLQWENSKLLPRQLYFEAEGDTAEHLYPCADAFAIACLPLATWHREHRLYVNGTLCTRLHKGLRFVSQLFLEWYPRYPMTKLMAADGFQPTSPPEQRRVVSLLSGGVDGLATLRQNRLDYPLDHPDSIRGCITLFGVNKFDHDEHGPVPARLVAFSQLLQRLDELACEEQFTLHPVYTNIRSLAPDYKFWTKMGFGAGHIAVAQLFQGHFDKVLFASDGEGHNPPAGAMHPLLNHHFSTDALCVQSDQDELLRAEKVALLADWNYAKKYMQPCHYVKIPAEGKINCGGCEKCVRTMMTLIGLGKLGQVSAFAENDLPAYKVFQIPVNNRRKADMLLQAIPNLQRVGRYDLVWAIRARVAMFQVLRT